MKPDRFRRREGIDLTRVRLTLDEGQLAARLDTPMTLHDTVVMMGWTEKSAVAIIDSLLDKGVLVKGEEATKAAYAGVDFPTPLMNATCDLTEEDRKRIIWHCEKLEDWTHYDVLGASTRDDPQEIKRKFNERIWQWHEDKLPKNLGPFRPLIRRVFDRLQVARRVLTSEQERAAYDREVVGRIEDQDDSAHLEAEVRRREREPLRELERKKRRRQRNPFVKNIAFGKQCANDARQLEEEGNYGEAERRARVALTYDPENEAYQQLVARLTDLAAEDRMRGPFKQGRSAEIAGEHAKAEFYYREAVRRAPKLYEPKKRLALVLLEQKTSVEEAFRLASEVAEAMTDDPEAHYVLGFALERKGARQAAIGSYKRAIKLKPNYSDAKKRLRIVRLGF